VAAQIPGGVRGSEGLQRSRGREDLTLSILPWAASLAEPAAEEPEGAVPCLLRPDGIVLGGRDTSGADGRLVGERMGGQVAVEIKSHRGFVQLLLQRIHDGDGEELVLGSPMSL